MTQATRSAGQSGIGYKRARDIAAPAHLGALIAAKPRIQAMIQDAVWVGLLCVAVIETATSTYLSATKIKPRQSCMFRRRLRQRTIGGVQGPGATNPTIASLEHPGSASQDEDGDGMDFSAPGKSRPSAPQLQAQLSRLTDRTRLRRLKNTLLSEGPGSK